MTPSRLTSRQAIAGTAATLFTASMHAQYALPKPKFRLVTLAERSSGDHQSFTDAARAKRRQWAPENNFTFDNISSTSSINDEFLAQYNLLLQLNHAPYAWAPTAQATIERYIIQGRGGWVGFHHAALLGDFDGYPMSPWFSQFMGGIRYTHYLPDFARGTVRIEDRSHSLAKDLPESFVIDKEEWYTWNHFSRPNVRVIATVDEATYQPNTFIKMGGDHPVVWSNPHYKARNAYIFMGHHGGLFDNPHFTQLFRNAIFWGAGQ